MSTVVAHNEHSFTEFLNRLREQYRRSRVFYRLRFSKDPEKLKAMISELEHWFYVQFASVMSVHKPTGLVRYADLLVKRHHHGDKDHRLDEIVSLSQLELEFSDMEALQQKLHALREAIKHELTCAICLGIASKPSVCLHCQTIIGCFECCTKAVEAAVKRNVVPKCPLCRGDWYQDAKRNVLQIRGLQELMHVAFSDEEAQ